MGNRADLNSRLYWVVGVGVVALVVAVSVGFFTGGEPSSTDALVSGQPTDGDDNQVTDAGGRGVPGDWAAGSDTPVAAGDGDELPESTEQPEEMDGAGESVGGDDAEESDDAGETDDADQSRSAQRPEGVGPRSWAAEPEDVDVEQLEERLDEGRMRQDFELAMRRDRRRSIDEARRRVARCESERTAGVIDGEIEAVIGDIDREIALQWTLRTDAGVGRIDDPEVLFRRGPKDEGFERCVTDGLDGVEFDATGDGVELDVRWASSR